MIDQGAFGLVINPAHQILLVQLPKDFKDFPEAWNFPGGFVKATEDPVDGAIREVLEETGIDCKVIAALDTVKLPSLTLYFFKCEYVSGTVKPYYGEIINAGWFSKAEALKLKLAFDIKQRIEYYL